MNQSPLRRAASAIRTASRILIACHVRPDGDALGSLLALGLGCMALGKRVVMVSPDGVPDAYRFLPLWECVATAAEGEFDLGIGVDADGSARLGSVEAAVLAAPQVIDLDHHIGPAPYGNIQVVDPSAAATGELVFALLDELGVPLTLEIAVSLMTAILTDTGSFRFSNVTPRTLSMAARLVEAGALPGPVYEAVYEQKPAAAVRIAGRALAGLQAEHGGQLVWSALSCADFAAAGATDEDTDGIVGHLQAVKGARVILLFRELADGEVRVSLRARDRTNMARVAQRFGGGGHAPAAGCTLPGPLAEAAARVVSAALEEMEVAEAGAGI
jgi:phosphoesterase RecJ-like protein